MTRTELRTLVESVTGRTDKTTLANSMLDLGIKAFCRRHSFRDLESESDLTTTDGTTYVVLPTNTRRLIQASFINDTQSWPLDLRTKKYLTDRWPNISSLSENKPVKGYVEGANLYLFPVPDDAYTIRVTVETSPASFASDSTENPVESLDLALVEWVSAFIFSAVENFDIAAYHRSLSSEAFSEAVRDDIRQRRTFRQHEGFRSPEESLNKTNTYQDPFARS